MLTLRCNYGLFEASDDGDSTQHLDVNIALSLKLRIQTKVCNPFFFIFKIVFFSTCNHCPKSGSLLIMKRKSIYPMEWKVSSPRMNAFYISLLTMKSSIAFGTVILALGHGDYSTTLLHGLGSTLLQCTVLLRDGRRILRLLRLVYKVCGRAMAG
jgi:hypothetical protein